jgi:hypothetical protein
MKDGGASPRCTADAGGIAAHRGRPRDLDHADPLAGARARAAPLPAVREAAEGLNYRDFLVVALILDQDAFPRQLDLRPHART